MYVYIYICVCVCVCVCMCIFPLKHVSFGKKYTSLLHLLNVICSSHCLGHMTSG